MVADFVSADYGWLCSPDGTESAHIVFKAGKAQDGYFTNTEIVVQLELAMDILEKHYPNDHHIFIFDNTTTHTKRLPTAPAAAKMTKNPLMKFRMEETVTVDRKIHY